MRKKLSVLLTVALLSTSIPLNGNAANLGMIRAMAANEAEETWTASSSDADAWDTEDADDDAWKATDSNAEEDTETEDDEQFDDQEELENDLVVEEATASDAEEITLLANVSEARIETQTGTCGRNLLWELDGETGVLTISGTGDMYFGSGVNTAPWMEYKDYITELVIEEGVTSIAWHAFENCSEIRGDLIIPDSVRIINPYAFRGCTGFDGILDLGQNIETIDGGAFEDCAGFVGSLTIPDSVLEFSDPFNRCDGFDGTLYIGKNISDEIGNDAYWFGNFKEIVVSDENESYTDYDGVLYTKDMSTVLFCPRGRTEQVNFVDGVKTIGDNAFEECRSLSGTIELPDSVVTIGSSAFSGCEGISGPLVLPNGIKTIASCAFENCSGLTGGLTIPDTVTDLGRAAFSGCSGFDGELKLSTGLTDGIHPSSFSGCSGLTGSLIIPDGLTWIGYDAFKDCSGFNGSLKLPDTMEVIQDNAFKNCSSFSGDLVLSDSVTDVGDYAFYCVGFDGSLIIGDGLLQERVGQRAFADTNFQGSLILGDGITDINADWLNMAVASFQGSLVINQYVSNIDTDCIWWEKFSEIIVDENNPVYSSYEGVLYDKDKKTLLRGPRGKKGTLKIAETTEVIADEAFRDADQITGDLIIPDGVVSIGDKAFAGCSQISGKLILPDSLVSIGESAFEDCSRMTGELVIPYSVVSLGGRAFYGCSSLTKLTILGNVSIGKGEFGGCNFDTVVIGAGVSVDSPYAFENTYIKHLIIPGTVDPGSVFGSPDLDTGMIVANVYYAGSKDDCDGGWITANFGCNFYYGSTGPGTGELDDESWNGDHVGVVDHLVQWDEESQAACFGNNDGIKSRVFASGGTDMSFLNQLDSLLNRDVYVVVDSETGRLIGIRPVECHYGIVDKRLSNIITIDGKEYELISNGGTVFFEGARIIYYLCENKVVDVHIPGSIGGKICGWSEGEQAIVLESIIGEKKIYSISPYMDPQTLEKIEEYFAMDWVKLDLDHGDNVFGIAKADRYPIEKPKDEYGVLGGVFDEEQDPVQGYLIDYFSKWLNAYDEFARACMAALNGYAGDTETRKEDAIKAQAEQMKKHDLSSYDKYISGTIGKYQDEAYEALARYFYEEVSNYSVANLSALDINSPSSGTKLINNIIQNISRVSKEYTIGGVNIEIGGNIGMGVGFGTMKINGGSPLVICSSQEEIKKTVDDYLDELKDLARSQTYKAVNIFYEETNSLSVWKVTESYLTQIASKIERRLGSNLSQIFQNAKVGDMFKNLDACYTYCSWIEKGAETAEREDIEELLKHVSDLTKFEDKTIKDAMVKAAMKKLKEAAEKMNRAFTEYLEGTIVDKENGFWRTLFECPVEVAVYDSIGNQIGYIGDNDIWFTEGLSIRRNGEAKDIYILTEDLPTFRVTATDYGEMDCVLEEYKNGNPTGRLNYYDIALAPNQEFTVALLNDLQTNADKIAFESEGNLIFADEYISVEDFAAVNIECSVEGIDETVVKGDGTYVRGNPVTVYAEQHDNYQFVGWYEDDELVSKDIAYSFTAVEDRSLTAVFCEDTSVSVKVNYSDGGIAIGAGRYEPDREVILLAIPDEGNSFEGWYLEDDCVSMDEEYRMDVYEDIVLEARFTQHIHDYSDPVFTWREDYSCAVKLICQEGHEEYTTECSVTKETIPAGELNDGKIIYTAEAVVDDVVYSDTKTVVLPATGSTDPDDGSSGETNKPGDGDSSDSDDDESSDKNDSYEDNEDSDDDSDTSTGTVTTDPKKGQMNSVTGIITGSGSGQSAWTQDENGWRLHYADGTWAAGSYVTDAQGNLVKDEAGNPIEQITWELINGAWYAFGVDGTLRTGFVYDYALAGWFYVDVNAGMKTGWCQINGAWYYFNPISDGTRGKMAVNTMIDGYFVDEHGIWKEEEKK